MVGGTGTPSPFRGPAEIRWGSQIFVRTPPPSGVPQWDPRYCLEGTCNMVTRDMVIKFWITHFVRVNVNFKLDACIDYVGPF